jgi:hypothetical protein
VLVDASLPASQTNPEEKQVRKQDRLPVGLRQPRIVKNVLASGRFSLSLSLPN